MKRQESVTFGRQLSSVTDGKQDDKAGTTLIEEEVAETGRVGLCCLHNDCLYMMVFLSR